MLNLSENNIHKRFHYDKFSAFTKVYFVAWENWFRKVLFLFFILVVIFMFTPWTQNINSKGYLTTLYPDQRPQTVHTMLESYSFIKIRWGNQKGRSCNSSKL